MKKTILLILILLTFTSAQTFAQRTGKPVMGKVAQYTMMGGLGGTGLFMLIWATDPLNPDFNLGTMALQGMSIGFIIGFASSIVVIGSQANKVPPHTIEKRIIQEERKKNLKDDAEKVDEYEYLDFGDVFNSDKNYFDQLEDDLNYRPDWKYLPPKYDPTQTDKKIERREYLTWSSQLFQVQF
mgnify:CR=1 FL=1